MKQIFNYLILNALATTLSFAQPTQKTTFLNVLTNLAKTYNLELSYSPDLVNLNDSTSFVFSKNMDSCIVQVEKLTHLEIQTNNSHLIILPAPKLIRLSGLVIDSRTKETLPYAHLLIKNTGKGTITNMDGKFDFKISSQLAGNEIQFSFLGYKNGMFAIPNSDSDSLIIAMEPKPYNLNDIYVLPNGNEVVDIVKKAVKNIKRNYHRTTVQMEAFYRNTSFRNDTASQLIEAVLLIEDKGIDNSATSTKIDLQEIRKSSNYLIPQDLKYSILEKFWGHKNVIYQCYNRNMARNYNTDWWFRPLTNYSDFKYEFEGFVWLDSIKVYKIKYIWNALLPDGKRVLEHENVNETGGYFYISTVDTGILKIEWFSWPLVYRLKKMGLNKKNSINYEVAYQKINGKYYLKYASGITLPNGDFVKFEDNDVPREKLKIKRLQWAEEILLVTQINTDRKEFDKIKYREKLARDENSYRKNYTYNAEFWRNYNVLKENPIEEKFIKEMEWEKSLELQFEENSGNHAEN